MILNDNDANSTQLEGKKLKGRGVVEGYKLSGQHLEIEEDTPQVQGDEPEREVHIELIDERETTKERDERLKREALQAKQTQEALRKQQGLVEGVDQKKDMNLELDKLEQGIVLSRTKGRPVNKQAFNNDPHAAVAKSDEHHETKNLRETDMPIVSALLGEGAKHLDFSNDIKIAEKSNPPEGSIAATKVEDIRGKEGPGLGV